MRNSQKFYTSPPGKSRKKTPTVKAPTYESPGTGKQKIGGMKKAKGFYTGHQTGTRTNRT